MDIQSLVVYKELDQTIKWLENLKPGIYDLQDKYIVLKEISFSRNGKAIIYKKGDEISLKKSTALKLKSDVIKLKPGDNSKQDTIRRIKQYIDFRNGETKEVTFSRDFEKIKVHPLSHD